MNVPDLEVVTEGDALRLSGRLGFANAAVACKAVAGRIDAGATSIDLRGLAATDSAALACLLAWRAQAARRGGTLALVGTPENLRALAQVSGVHELLEGAASA